jgi:hypothetical protein
MDCKIVHVVFWGEGVDKGVLWLKFTQKEQKLAELKLRCTTGLVASVSLMKQ